MRGDELAGAQVPAETYFRRRAALAFLAPDIQRAVLSGEIGHLNVGRLLRGGIPLAWADQRRLFGI
jgi:hypothetical protein